MRLKFYEKLKENHKWRVEYQGEKYSFQGVEHIISSQSGRWVKDKYYVAVGHNSFEFFVYVMLASKFGLKIILCDPKMLNILLTNYSLDYESVLSTKSIDSLHVQLKKVSLKSRNHRGCFGVNEGSQAQIIFFTSGTTSLPKLVCYDEDALIRNALLVGRYLEIDETSKCLCMFPTNYMYGFSMLMCSVLRSGTVMLERSTLTAQEIWGYLKNENITVLPIIRSIIEKMRPLIQKNDDFFKNLTILNASDRIYVENVEDILSICPRFWNNFGQTESAPRIFALVLEQADLKCLDKYSHNGVVALGRKVHPLINISIVNEYGIECKKGEIGELKYSTPFAMSGYLSRKGHLITHKVFSSGDLVYENEYGLICWVGRKNETVKIDGKYLNFGLLHKYFDRLNFLEKSYFVHDEDAGLSGYFVVDAKLQEQVIKIEKTLLSIYRKQFPSYPRLQRVLLRDKLPTTLSGKVKISDLHYLTKSKKEVHYVM